jgi:hypothetical protein
MGVSLLTVLWILHTLYSPGEQTGTKLACPTSVTVTQAVQNAPSGWEAVNGSGAAQLERAAFYLMHPSKGGSLAPDGTKKSKGEERDTWTFVRKPGDEFWLGCVYQGTTVILARKLDNKVSRCDVSYELLPSGSRLRLKGISCKSGP